MKKSALKVLAALAFVAVATSVKAAPTATVNIVLLLADLHVTRVGGDTLQLQAAPGSTGLIAGPAFRNDSSVTVTFEVHVSSSTEPWYLVGDAAATLDNAQYRIFGIWRHWDTGALPLLDSQFVQNDVLRLPDDPVRSSATDLACEACAAPDSDAFRGFNVPGSFEHPGVDNSNRQRNIFFRVDFPAAGGTVLSNEKTVTVTATLP